ncbi:MAG TPA: ABC transporter permease, partial [Bacteroidales bacterium]|nr:ABC transporter permease [Bacteroidales bacterium]
HQPSSDMFKLFNEIVIMDKGGYPVYFGNPLDSISYLKSVAQRADAAEIECQTCGNVNTDDILKIIEAKKVNDFGEYVKERQIIPEDWYQLFKERIDNKPETIQQEPLPRLNFKVPGRIQQFIIYSRRNFFTKLADKQFVALSLLITPVLALILGFFTKYLGGIKDGDPQYVFSLNENIPAYLFMTVIVSLFVGMIISAEEIIRDRKIRARESFLNLSKYAYYNSKIIFLILLSAFQMFVFVLIGNAILEIKGLNLNYWLILFSSSCFAVLLGLNISAGLKSIISIYINIPFILVPLILLSGVIVKYDKLHPSVAAHEYVPITGDLMASRWAYEALVVNQYKNNAFEKLFFELDRKQGNAQYYTNYLIPDIRNRVSNIIQAERNNDKELYDRSLSVIQNTLPALPGVPPELLVEKGGSIDLSVLTGYLNQLDDYLNMRSHELTVKRDSVVNVLTDNGMKHSKLVQMKRDYQNEAISDLVLNTNELKKIVEYKGRLIRKDTPIYQYTQSKMGRSQFFAASKNIGGIEIDTVKFNIIILWLMSIILYIALLNDWLRRLLNLLKSGHRD